MKKYKRQKCEEPRYPCYVPAFNQAPIENSPYTKNINGSELTALGKYIHQGHFGEVFQGTLNGNRVAIKLPKNEQDCRQHFLHECNITDKLDSPHIIKFHGVWLGENHIPRAIVMEFASKGSLQDTLYNPNINLSTDQQIKFAYAICCGLSYLHQKLIAHLDLHSGNILLCENNTVKLADFGTAQDLSNIKPLAYLGKPTHLAPELLLPLSFKNVSAKCDIYSLAIVLFEIIMRKPPYEEDCSIETIKQKLTKNERPAFNQQTLSLFTQTINQAWNTDPAARPNIEELTPRFYNNRQ